MASISSGRICLSSVHIAALRSCHKMRILSTGCTASVRRHEVEGRSDAIDRRLHLRDSDHLMKHKKAALNLHPHHCDVKACLTFWPKTMLRSLKLSVITLQRT